MRPDVVKFHHRQLPFIDEKFYHMSVPKGIELLHCSFECCSHDTWSSDQQSVIFNEADILMLDNKITV